MKDHEKADILRMRWRADMLEYGAAGHESFGDMTNANLKREQAAALRTLAAETENYLSKLDAAQANGDQQAVKHLMSDWIRFMESWRGAANRGRTRPQTVDHFLEPSDEELLAAAGGNV